MICLVDNDIIYKLARCNLLDDTHTYVKALVVPARACDTALSAAFGSGWDATEPNVLGALNSYINELRSLPMDLLTHVDWPPRG